MQRTIKGAIFGEYGIGKTSLLNTLPPETTLALDLEAGMLSVQEWNGEAKLIRTWQDAKRIAVLVGGVDPAAEQGKAYSKEHYDVAREAFPDIDLSKIETVFIDSITVASRLALKWCKQQPESHDKQGNFSNLKCYGLLGQEMMGWFTHLQHTPDKNIWFVGLMQPEKSDLGEVSWSIQMEGSKAGNELPGILDQVITMAKIKIKKEEQVSERRGFVCDRMNKWGYPAKDRSGVLSAIEPPHLGNLMNKIFTEKRSTFQTNTEAFLEDEIIY